MSILTQLSHEIRTPLNSMLALSQLLRDGLAGKLNPEQQRYVEVIERNGRNLMGLVNDVLDLSRLTMGYLDVNVRTLQVGEQVGAAVAALAPLAQAKGIALVAGAMDHLPLVDCDPERLRQVLTNLIGNAIKFTDRGQVTVLAAVRRGCVAVEVRDTGVGIPETARSRLFEEFFRVGGPAGGRAREGAGLGLAIASRLVRLMGGQLSVDSEEGIGSRFTFTLPLGRCATARGATDANRVPHSRPASPEMRLEGGERARADDGLPGSVNRQQDELHGTNTAD